MKWLYLNNMGVLANDEEAKLLENHCNTKGPEDPSKFEHVAFHVVNSLIEEAKSAVKKIEAPEDIKEDIEEEKPKRKRRTKAEIEADEAGK
jgi:hypothetical protein